MTFCTWLPNIAASIVAGPVIDRYHKKTIMLLADLLAAVCSLTVAALRSPGIWWSGHFIVNGITGFMNAFQFPAETVAVGMLVRRKSTARPAA